MNTTVLEAIFLKRTYLSRMIWIEMEGLPMIVGLAIGYHRSTAQIRTTLKTLVSSMVLVYQWWR